MKILKEFSYQPEKSFNYLALLLSWEKSLFLLIFYKKVEEKV